MSDTEIMICPCCNKEITPDDDYVVCSVCRTPHHTECWLKEKHCSAEGCDGTSTSSGYGKTDSPFYINISTEIVPEKTYAPESVFDFSDDSEVVEDFVTMALVERKAEYYLPKFNMMASTNSKISFNLAACVLGWYWSLYRKLYKPAFILMAAEVIVFNLPVSLYIKYPIVGMMFLVNGFIGNYLYKQRIDKCRTEAMTLREPKRSEYIVLNGGVDSALPVVMFVITCLIAVLRFTVPLMIAFFKTH